MLQRSKQFKRLHSEREIPSNCAICPEWDELRRQIYYVLEESDEERRHSSRLKSIVAVYIFAMILISLVGLIAETMSSFAAVPTSTWAIIDGMTSVSFTIEYLLRFWVCDVFGTSAVIWGLRAMNLCDLVAVLPFYVELFSNSDMSFLRVLRVLRLLKFGRYHRGIRVMTVALGNSLPAMYILVFLFTTGATLFGCTVYFIEKFACPDFGSGRRNGLDEFVRYNEDCDYGSVGHSPGLGACCAYQCLGIPATFGLCGKGGRHAMAMASYSKNVSALAMFTDAAAQDWSADPLHELAFTSAFVSVWWAVVTMSSVGYGDIVPQNWFSKVVASMAMVSGMLIIAMPFAVVGLKFGEAVAMFEADESVQKRHLKPRLTNGNDSVAKWPSQPRESMQRLKQIMQESQDVKKEILVVQQIRDNLWTSAEHAMAMIALEGLADFDENVVKHPYFQKKTAAGTDPNEELCEWSLYIFHRDSLVRRSVIRMTRSPIFDNLVLLVILANSAILANLDYYPRKEPPWGNKLHHMTEVPFIIAYTSECAAKIVALGFIMDPNSYLRDAWNWIDFIVVITGLTTLIDVGSDLTILRIVRVLRPLRTVSILPGMRRLVNTILRSLPGLKDAVLMSCFLMGTFGILGLHFFGGIMHRRCRLTPQPLHFTRFATQPGCHGWCFDDQSDVQISLSGGSLAMVSSVVVFDTFCRPLPACVSAYEKGADYYAWPLDPLQERFCGSYMCRTNPVSNVASMGLGVQNISQFVLHVLEPMGAVDRSGEEVGLPTICGSPFQDDKRSGPVVINHELEGVYVNEAAAEVSNEAFNWGLTHFDQLAAACLVVFQCVTLEGWVDIMYMLQDADNSVRSFLFFTLVVIIGYFFLLNVILAIVYDAFCAADESQKAGEASASNTQSFSIASTPDLVHPFNSPDSPGKPVHVMSICVWLNAITVALTRLVRRDHFGDIDDLLHTSHPWRLRRWARWVAGSIVFDNLVMLMISLNVVVLALDSYPHPLLFARSVSDALDVIFNVIFIIEFLILHIALGALVYWCDNALAFDGLIVLLSVADLAAVLAGIESGMGSIRALRMLRILKLASKFENMRVLLAACFQTLLAMREFCLLLALVVCMFALVGQSLFAGSFLFADGEVVRPEEFHQHCRFMDEGHGKPDCVPRAHFDTFLWSVLTVFQVLTGENWNTVMYDAMRATGWQACMFFIVLMIVGQFLIFNLCLSILMMNFEQHHYRLRADAHRHASRTHSFIFALRESANISRGRVLAWSEQRSQPSVETVRQIEVMQVPQHQGQGEMKLALPEEVDDERKKDGLIGPARVLTATAQGTRAEVHSGIEEVEGNLMELHGGIEEIEVTAGQVLQPVSRKTEPPIEKDVSLSRPTSKEAERSVVPGHLPCQPAFRETKGLSPPRSPRPGSTEARHSTGSGKPSSPIFQGRQHLDLPHDSVCRAPSGESTRDLVSRIHNRLGMLQPPGSHEHPMIPDTLGVDDANKLPPLVASNLVGMVSHGRSCLGFAETNPLRVFCMHVAKSTIFEQFVIFCITLSSALMALQNPLHDPDGATVVVERWSNIVFTAIFTAEMVIKMIAFGICCGKPGQPAYLQSSWNLLDGFIVVVSIFDLAGGAHFASGENTDILSFVKIFRMARMLRPLRLIQHNANLRTIVRTIGSSLPGLCNLLAFSSLFYLMFALLGVSMLKGSFYRCADMSRADWSFDQQLNVTPVCIPPAPNSTGSPVARSAAIRGLRSALSGGCPNSWDEWQRPTVDTPVCEVHCSARTDHPLCSAGEEPWGYHIMRCSDCQAAFCMRSTTEASQSSDCLDFCAKHEYFCRDQDSLGQTGCLRECVAQCLCPDECVGLSHDAALCVEQGGRWMNMDMNFDNLLSGMTALFEISTTEGWVDLMLSAIDARGPYLQPHRDANELLGCIAGIVFMLTGSFFILNLCVGVIIDSYHAQKEQRDRLFVTEAQACWLSQQRALYRYRSFFLQTNLHYLPPTRRHLMRIVTSARFEQVIIVCIVLNAMVLGLAVYPRPTNSYNWWLDTFTAIFAAVFNVEAVVKLVAMRFAYFREGWNIFDFFCVFLSDLFIILRAVESRTDMEAGSFINGMRILRILRLFRLVRMLKGLNQLTTAFILSVPKLVNVGIIMMLLVYLYAILGVNLFAEVAFLPGASYDENANFRSLGQAFSLLIRSVTGEGWNAVMHDLSKDKFYYESYVGIHCVDSMDITAANFHNLDRNNDGVVDSELVIGCGKQGWAFAYFITYTLIVTFVILNLFIAVIFEGFEESNSSETSDLLARVLEVWRNYDPNSTMIIPLSLALDCIDRVVHEITTDPSCCDSGFQPLSRWDSAYLGLRPLDMSTAIYSLQYMRVLNLSVTSFDEVRFIVVMKAIVRWSICCGGVSGPGLTPCERMERLRELEQLDHMYEQSRAGQPNGHLERELCKIHKMEQQQARTISRACNQAGNIGIQTRSGPLATLRKLLGCDTSQMHQHRSGDECFEHSMVQRVAAAKIGWRVRELLRRRRQNKQLMQQLRPSTTTSRSHSKISVTRA